LSDDFKEKLKAYADGRLSEEDKLLMEKELEKLETYQEFLEEQIDKEPSKEPFSKEYLLKSQDKIIRKSKWKARLQNACITLIIFSISLMLMQTLTSKYYNFGNPSKRTLYRNAIKAAIQTTRPNADAKGSTLRKGTFFSNEIGITYSKKIGRDETPGGNVTLKFNFSKPSIVTDESPDSINFNNFFFDAAPYNNENANIALDPTMWNTLEKLPEGTVAEAYITFNKLYKTEEVLDIFKNKDMNLLWLAVDTGIKENPSTVLGFPHKEDFPELRRNWFDPPPKVVQHYTNGEFRNEYFIDTLKFLNEHKDIANAVDSIGSMANIQEALNYVNKNGVKILGVAITGPTKEILKLREDNLVKRIIVGETRLWNWD
jgi:hypothetical protein